MAYIIAEPCVGTCDTACVEVCPVDCIHGPEDTQGSGAEAKEPGFDPAGKMLYIDPEECIDHVAHEGFCAVVIVHLFLKDLDTGPHEREIVGKSPDANPGEPLPHDPDMTIGKPAHLLYEKRTPRPVYIIYPRIGYLLVLLSKDTNNLLVRKGFVDEPDEILVGKDQWYEHIWVNDAIVNRNDGKLFWNLLEHHPVFTAFTFHGITRFQPFSHAFVPPAFGG